MQERDEDLASAYSEIDNLSRKVLEKDKAISNMMVVIISLAVILLIITVLKILISLARNLR